MKKIVITGASSGIGLAIAQQFAANGHQVYAGVRSDEDYTKLHENENITPVYLDVTNTKQIEKTVSLLQEKGGIDVLINNAGIGMVGPVLEIPIKKVEKQFQVNIYGMLRMIQAFKQQLIDNKGHIINVSSLNGHRPSKFGVAYNMSKFAVEALSETLRMEVEKFGISVTTLNPGQYKTPIFHKMKDRILEMTEMTKLYKEEYNQMSEMPWTEIGREPEIIGKETVELLDNKPSSFLSASQKERMWTYDGMIQRIEEVVTASEDEKIDLITLITRIKEMKNDTTEGKNRE